MCRTHVNSLDVQRVCEPGRLSVGKAGVLVTKVIYGKRGEGKTFVIVDAAMNDLVRTTLYEAHHDVKPVREAPVGGPTMHADVVGPVCETGDYLAPDRDLPELAPGELSSIMSAGA